MTAAIDSSPDQSKARQSWADWLYMRSILKQLKFENIRRALGSVDGKWCLDIGSDNGVISYKLRQLGGSWTSADIDPRSVALIREHVHSRVHQIDDRRTPFKENEFDSVVVVDFLEHIVDDAGFMLELNRILSPGGTLILNAPHDRGGWLMWVRQHMGLTEETHGHLRPGYTPGSLEALARYGRFRIEFTASHTRSIAKLLDSVMVWAISRLTKKRTPKGVARGLVVDGGDLNRHEWAARLFTVIYPLIFLISKLDSLLFFDPGHMLITRATKPGGDMA